MVEMVEFLHLALNVLDNACVVSIALRNKQYLIAMESDHEAKIDDNGHLRKFDIIEKVYLTELSDLAKYKFIVIDETWKHKLCNEIKNADSAKKTIVIDYLSQNSDHRLEKIQLVLEKFLFPG